MLPHGQQEVEVNSSGQRCRWPERGFSLLELLIVVALIFVLSTMLYSSGSRSSQQRQKLACQKNLQTIYLALQIYANDHDGVFPAQPAAQSSEDVLSVLVPRYSSLTEPFICPGSKDEPLPEGEPFAKRRISYAYYMGWRVTNTAEVLMTDRQINTQPKASGQPIFSTDGKAPGNNHRKYGGNLLYCDGHLEMTPPLARVALTPPKNVVLLNPRPR